MKKRLIPILSLVFVGLSLNAQLLNLPESVEYDPYHNSYLVSNWGDGDIIQVDSAGNQSVWLSNVKCFAGLHRIDSILYVACREYGVKGFNLFTGDNVLNVSIPVSTNINDITADNSGNLYVSYPPGNVVYKVNIASGQYWVFADNNLNFPNGMYFEEENNRLILVSYRMNSTVQQINLADSTVSLITDPGLHNLDGISRDNEGNYYVSSWYSNSVYKFDETFTNPPEVFSFHNSDPADIYFDKINNVLAVPLFFTHQLEFVAGTVTGFFPFETLDSNEFLNIYNFPNPFHQSTSIKYGIISKSQVTLTISDASGKLIKTLVNKMQQAGDYEMIWNGTNNSGQIIPEGVYYCTFQIGTTKHCIKIIKTIAQ